MADIVIIDDEPMVRLTLRGMLEYAGHEVREAGDGREGLALCDEQCPDIVITDIIMPEQEGIETIRALRRDLPHVRVIAISGGGRFDNAELLRIALRLGAARVLAKPFRRAELVKAVDEVLRKAWPA